MDAGIKEKKMIKIELNQEEVQALINLMNAGVKSMGITSVKAAAVLVEKVEKAIEADKSSNVVDMDKAS